MAATRRNRRPYEAASPVAPVQRGERPWREVPVENWWTPTRVRAMLQRYPTLCQALDGLRATCLQPYESHTSPPSEARFADALQRKADLDRAIASLPPRLRRVAEVYWQQEGDAVNIAHEERITERHSWRLVADAEEALTEKLCGACQ